MTLEKKWNKYTSHVRKNAIQVAGVCHYWPDICAISQRDMLYQREGIGRDECLILSSNRFPVAVTACISTEFDALANILIDYILDDVRGGHHL